VQVKETYNTLKRPTICSKRDLIYTHSEQAAVQVKEIYYTLKRPTICSQRDLTYAVQELLRLRASIPLSPAALSAFAGSAGAPGHAADLPTQKVTTAKAAEVDVEASKEEEEEVLHLYRRAQGEVKEEVREQVEPLVELVKTVQQELYLVLASLAQEVKRDLLYTKETYYI
jgi:hypothetical protein